MLMHAIHSPGEAVVIFVVVIIMMIVGAVSAARQGNEAAKRTADLRRLAPRLGFTEFNANRDDTFVLGWGFLKRLSEGTSRYAFNILRGTYQDQALFVFDYCYKTDDGRRDTPHYCTMLMLIVKGVFPHLIIGTERPHELFSRIQAAIDGENIQFESAEFSKVFRVRSFDKKFAYDVCNPQMMEYLLANRDLDIEIQGPAILLTFTPPLPVGEIEFNLQRLAQIRALLPQYLFTNA